MENLNSFCSLLFFRLCTEGTSQSVYPVRIFDRGNVPRMGNQSVYPVRSFDRGNVPSMEIRLGRASDSMGPRQRCHSQFEIGPHNKIAYYWIIRRLFSPNRTD
uniref:Secreted protein n=1 Tax=Cacopsylla melanoneura TaxID=428564 RepID=A0A8D9E7K6_9HEMI